MKTNDTSEYRKLTDEKIDTHALDASTLVDDSSVLCKVSLCTPEENTQPNNSAGPRGIIVEFENKASEIYVHPGDKVKTGQTIGTIDGAVVTSISDFNVTESHQRYFIGDYVDVSNYDENSISELMKQSSQFDELNDILNTNTNVNSFIKDYLPYCQYPVLATTTAPSNGGLIHETTTTRLNEKYVGVMDEYIDAYNDEVEKLCKKKAKTYAEENRLDELKSELDDKKNNLFKNIIGQYDQVTVNNTYSNGTIASFLMYDNYVGYLTSDRFVYDDSNPYVVELFNYLLERVGIRDRLEKNMDNMSSNISAFNDAAYKVLGGLWDLTKEKDYYGELRSRFAYNYYSNESSIESLAKADAADKNRKTLYSMVLDFLKAKVNYDGMSEQKKEIGDNVEYDDILEGLKKIALAFCRLRNIETSFDSDKYLSYIDKDDLNNVFTLRSVTEDAYIDNYANKDYNNIGVNDNISATTYTPNTENDNILKKYLGALKSVTDEESVTIKGICDKAVTWYKTYHESIDDLSIFNSFKSVSWGTPSTIYKDGREYDFYFLTVSDGKNAAAPKDYEYTEDSYLTEYGIDSLKYWMRYLSIATALNCTLPAFWSTGLIVSGASVKLPILLVPAIVIPGSVTFVIGVGVCGIAIYPMVLCVNMGKTTGAMIPILNTVVDGLKKSVKMKMENAMSSIGNVTALSVEALDKKIDETKKTIENIDDQIEILKTGVDTDREELRKLLRRQDKDTTTKSKEKGDD